MRRECRDPKYHGALTDSAISSHLCLSPQRPKTQRINCRLGDNLFSESLVAVDLNTGERKWHYQLVHHGIWDHDIPCAPILADVVIDGQLRKIVAQPTKQAFLYVFDRVSAETRSNT